MTSGNRFVPCDLCGLAVRQPLPQSDDSTGGRRFCCTGCRMVFKMLMEVDPGGNPADFRRTDLYRRCQAAGIIPASQDQQAQITSDEALLESPGSDAREVDDSRTWLEHQWRLDGMWCPACAWVVTRLLGRLDGVADVTCQFSTDTLQCRYDPTRISPDQISAAVGRLGYRANDLDRLDDDRQRKKEILRLIVSGLLSVNAMMLSWALYTGFFMPLSAAAVAKLSFPIAVMATIVMAYGGAPVFRKAWSGLAGRAPGMETLVALGAGAAYLLSFFNLVTGSLHLYFDTAAMLITLVLTGKLIEQQAKRRVGRSLAAFLNLQPNKVRICSPSFPAGRYAHIDQLRAGDRFRVEVDEIIAADGRVIDGSALVDESALTGEARPRKLAAGDAVKSGARVIDGRVTVDARQVGNQAMLGQMIDTVRRSLAQKSPFEGRWERGLRYFVPVVVALALATVIGAMAGGVDAEQALVRAVTVLVIACPCALGIAIPLARVAGMTGAGKRGILVRDVRAFERSRRVDSVVFDKTGTLTRGHWALEQILACGSWSPEQIIAAAAGLEQGTTHFIARAIDRYARRQKIAPLSMAHLKSEPRGIQGQYQGRRWRIGRSDFVLGPDAVDRHKKDAGSVPDRLQSIVCLSVDGRMAARLVFGDQLHTAARDTVVRLQEAGLDCAMISGDAPETTRVVGRALGIEAVQGGLLPLDKADYIARLQSAGRTVAMVGDGVNDAPALSRADLSIAVYSGHGLSEEMTAVTLMRGDPGQLIDFFHWSSAVNRKVAQNLACALGYNLLSVPVAMAGLLTPLLAATAMLASSLTVIFNTLRLSRQAVAGDETSFTKQS